MKKQKKACGVTGETQLCKTLHIWPLEKGINLNLMPHYLIDSKMIHIFYIRYGIEYLQGLLFQF